jgi:hypothetical protein
MEHSEIEEAFKTARGTMRKYWLTILYRHYQADKKREQSADRKTVWKRRMKTVQDFFLGENKSELPTAHVLGQMRGLLPGGVSHREPVFKLQGRSIYAPCHTYMDAANKCQVQLVLHQETERSSGAFVRGMMYQLGKDPRFLFSGQTY